MTFHRRLSLIISPLPHPSLRQVGTLLGGAQKAALAGMRNLAMELRKLCCHPFLCDGLEEEIAMRRALAVRREGCQDSWV